MAKLSSLVALSLVLLVGHVFAQERAEDPPLAPVGGGVAPKVNAMTTSQDLVRSIIGKMEYDRQYFGNLLRLQQQGKRPMGMTEDVFRHELRRAQNLMPVIARFFEQRARFEKGEPFGLPHNPALHRVYTNLIAMLNVVQAADKKDFNAALFYGEKVVVADKESLGQVRGEKAEYYVQLYRHFFYLMASVNYQLGQDGEAIKWLARLDSDVNLQGLKQAISLEKPATEADNKFIEMEKLRALPMAVMPLENVAKKPELDWLSRGLMEVFTADLAQFTDLTLIERGQLEQVFKEIKLEQLGLTQSAEQNQIGKMLGAGTLLVGSYQPAGADLLLTLRFVSQEGKVLAAASGPIQEKELFAQARVLLLKVFDAVEWIDPASENELKASRAPKTSVVRDLMQARTMLATKSGDAKALYARAMREDPVFARKFEELKTEFKDVSAAVAVLPFVNVSGDKKDEWMSQGAVEALASDLPRLNFTVVERTQLAALLRERQLKETLDTSSGLEMGKQVGADWVVLGSVLHQAPQIRIDTRFVDVKTGIILFTVSVEDREDDFMSSLTELSKAIATNLNEKLSEQTLDQLMGKKMAPEEFEKYVRQQLSKESLAATQLAAAAKQKPADRPEPPGRSRLLFWTGVGVAAGGAILAGVSFSQSSTYSKNSGYYDTLRQLATTAEQRAKYQDLSDSSSSHATTWSTVGYISVGLVAVAVGGLVWDMLFHPDPQITTSTDVVPSIALIRF